MFFVGIVKLNRNSIVLIENISIVFQLILSLTVKLHFIKKVDSSEFGIYSNSFSIKITIQVVHTR
jgi:hypothetical protein